MGLKLLLSGNKPGRKGVKLPGPILDEIRSLFDVRGRHFGDEISRCFGIDDVGALSRKGSGDDAHVVIRNLPSDGSVPCDHDMRLGKRGAVFNGSFPEHLQISGDDSGVLLKDIVEDFFRRLGKGVLEMFLDEDDDSDFFTRTVVEILEKTTRNRLVGALNVPAFYLPADRTGIMHTHGAMISGIIGNTPTIGSRHAVRTPMLSGVLADFLQRIIEADRMGSKDDHPLPKIGARIDKKNPSWADRSTSKGPICLAFHSSCIAPKGGRRRCA